MDHGRILALDTPAALKASVGAGRMITVTASGDLTHLGAALVAAVDGVDSARVGDSRIHLGVDDSRGLLPRIIAAAEEAGHEVYDLSVTEPTLESVFIHLTGRDLRE